MRLLNWDSKPQKMCALSEHTDGKEEVGMRRMTQAGLLLVWSLRHLRLLPATQTQAPKQLFLTAFFSFVSC